jgi:hypothetical protein
MQERCVPLFMTIHTPKFLFNTSIDYFNIAQARCDEIFSSNYQEDASLFMKISAPATILSFSVELIIKSILLKRNNHYSKAHKLLDLYKSVPSDDKKLIESKFANISADNFNYPTFRFIVDMYDAPASKTAFANCSEEINYKLTEHDNSFVNWRYIASFSVDSEDKLRHYDFAFICKFYNAFYIYMKEIV